MAWISFSPLPWRKKNTWWQLASLSCWNHARPWHASELVSFMVGLRTYQHPGINFQRTVIFMPFPLQPPDKRMLSVYKHNIDFYIFSFFIYSVFHFILSLLRHFVSYFLSLYIIPPFVFVSFSFNFSSCLCICFFFIYIFFFLCLFHSSKTRVIYYGNGQMTKEVSSPKHIHVWLKCTE